ncbi:helix-turn-helix domain-containing protein [Nocardia sp. CDC160]|uniref:helix-turn-helix domain-containing protein n=1 Tax=Nocardia sp. CDC160 TaxID=3112166 RepID=UPI002DBDC35A|nr:helix-turn-helix transcriptional regulator [Nocardia sp. CDC160]MEC3920222.1 helix-turn-helix transcriptional regulator [Nocardia sp. CDC160]
MTIGVMAERDADSGDIEGREDSDVPTPRQAAAELFSSRLSELIAESMVSTEDGSTRSLTLYALAQHLELAYPDVPVSQSGLYRLIHGDAIPRLDLIIALARVFDVPPEYFVTGDKKP